MNPRESEPPACVFCDIAAGRAPAERVYEDDGALAFLDIRPRSPGHTLVIPRGHATTLYDLDDQTAACVARAMARVARALRAALAPEGLAVRQSNGRAAGQEVMHVHFHLIPVGVSQAPLGRTAAERSELAERIRAALKKTG